MLEEGEGQFTIDPSANAYSKREFSLKEMKGAETLNPKISVVIPAFNEEKTIEDVIFRTCNALESTCLPYEVIVVDDGSTDRTKELAHCYNVTVLTNGANQGKGYALKRGFEYARGDVIITIDSDGSHVPEEIKILLVQVLNGADVVLGSRFQNGLGRQGTKRLHVFGNKLINLLIRIITQKCITDSQTGFRAYKKEIIKKIRLSSKGYQIETELTVKALKNGNVVREVPITFEKRAHGHSHLNPLRDGLKIFKTIINSSVNY